MVQLPGLLLVIEKPSLLLVRCCSQMCEKYASLLIGICLDRGSVGRRNSVHRESSSRKLIAHHSLFWRAPSRL